MGFQCYSTNEGRGTAVAPAAVKSWLMAETTAPGRREREGKPLSEARGKQTEGPVTKGAWEYCPSARKREDWRDGGARGLSLPSPAAVIPRA